MVDGMFLTKQKKKWGFSLFHSCLSCLFNFKEVRGFTRGGNVETLKRGGRHGERGGRKHRHKEKEIPENYGGGIFFSFFFSCLVVSCCWFSMSRERVLKLKKKKKEKENKKNTTTRQGLKEIKEKERKKKIEER